MRPGGWVPGIGWVARYGALPIGTRIILNPASDCPLTINMRTPESAMPAWRLVTVARWADGTVPEEPRADELVEVGWLGTPWDEAEWLMPTESPDLDEGEAIGHEGEDPYVYTPGDWALRHEDGSGDLIAPIPIYARKAELGAYTNPAAGGGS